MRFPRNGDQQYLGRTALARSARRTGQLLRPHVASPGNRDPFDHHSCSALSLPLVALRFSRAVNAGCIFKEIRNAGALDAHFEAGLPSDRFRRSRCRHSRVLRKSLSTAFSEIKLEGSVRHRAFVCGRPQRHGHFSLSNSKRRVKRFRVSGPLTLLRSLRSQPSGWLRFPNSSRGLRWSAGGPRLGFRHRIHCLSCRFGTKFAPAQVQSCNARDLLRDWKLLLSRAFLCRSPRNFQKRRPCRTQALS